MKPIDPKLRLQRIPNLDAKIASNNNVVVWAQGGSIHCGPDGLAVLQAFTRPTTLPDALQVLKSQLTGNQSWIDLTTTIVQLYNAGIIRSESDLAGHLSNDGTGFDAAPVHISMLDDRVRTESFIKAIGEVVKEGDVVLDLGTGSGVLAIAAARAGARKVYAIEAASIGNATRKTFAQNNLSDRITLIQGWSTQLELPEPADVLVSEIIGNEPLDERLLELTTDSKQRLLKPDARLLPSRIKLFAVPVTIPPAMMSRHVFTSSNIENWKRWYGIDFLALSEVVQEPATIYLPTFDLRSWDYLGKPVPLVDVDLNQNYPTTFNLNVTAPVEKKGLLNGIVVFFEIQLSPNVNLSTDPLIAKSSCSWRCPVWPLENAVRVEAGQSVQINYTYRLGASMYDLRVTF